MITETGIDVVPKVALLTTRATRYDVIGSTATGNMILVLEQSEIGGVCRGPGYHKMGREGVGMRDQDQLFLRGVVTGVNADDNEPVFIW